MTIAAPAARTAPNEPVRGRLSGAIEYARHYAATGGILLWGAGAAVLAVHSMGMGLPDPTRFAMLDSWLIGLACLGCPMLALRSLGRWCKPQTCMMIAVACFALALLLTVLALGGAMHPNTLNGTFEVILPEAAGIHAINAADAEVHAARRESAAYERGYGNALTALTDQRCAALASLGRIEGMTAGELGELRELIDIAEAALAADRPQRSMGGLATVTAIDGSTKGTGQAAGWTPPAPRANGVHVDRA